jgi:hypothetical protein
MFLQGCSCSSKSNLSGVTDFFNALLPGAQEVAKSVSAIPGSQADLLSKLITQVDVETAYGPPITLKDPLKPGPPNPYLMALKPRVTLHVAGQQFTMQPYGDPGPTKWPFVATGAALVGAAGVAFVAYRIVKGVAGLVR